MEKDRTLNKPVKRGPGWSQMFMRLAVPSEWTNQCIQSYLEKHHRIRMFLV